MQPKQALRMARRVGAEYSINLAKRRAWFADDAQANPSQGGAGTSSAGTQNTEHMIPKSRLDEALERARKAEELLAQVQTTAQAAEQERLKRQGEWQQIAENATKEAEALKSFKQRAETLENTIKSANETRIAQVPESRRKLIPLDYPPERLQTWLTDNWQDLQAQRAPDIDAGAGAGNGGKTLPSLTPQEVEIARLAGMKPEEYAQQKAKQAARKE